MSPRGGERLKVVGADAPAAEAEAEAPKHIDTLPPKAKDRAYWDRLHIRAAKNEPIWLPDRPRATVLLRRLFKFEERS